tara:strand:+ start:565 stop:1209 length:645 start_codon:yes stop_codon:yes gene_type:complete
MDALKINFSGSSNVGLYGFATNKYCLIGKGVEEEVLKKIKDVLKVPVYEITINNSRLVGSYCCGNNEIIFVPEIIKEHEEKELKKLKIPYEKIKTKFSALGNNIVIKDKNALINPEFEKDIELTGIKLKRMNIGKHNAIGSCMIVNPNGCVTTMETDDKEVEEIKKTLSLKVEVGSVNRGNPYVRSGIIANSRGYIIGNLTTGVEVMRIESALK